MKPISLKRTQWLKDYHNILKSTTPTHCARCERVLTGGWVPHGEAEPHHPYGRSKRVYVASVLPLCSSCHHGFVHTEPNKAREDGWLVNPRSKQDRDDIDMKKLDENVIEWYI